MNDFAEAIILKQSDYRERDVLFTVLTKEYGKLSFVANGARKLTSKNASKIYPYTVARLSFDYVPSKTMFRLKTAETITMNRRIHEDLTKSSVAAILCEMVDALTMFESQSNLSQEYALLKKGLNDVNSGYDEGTVLSLFISDLLTMFGSAPDVDECTVCQKKTVRALSVKAGGFLCEEHALMMDVPFSKSEDLKRFRLLCKATLNRIELVCNTSLATMEDVSILVEFFESYTGIHLKSYPFFQSVLQLNNRV